ncbi:MAG: hypothetical protein GY714_30680 [Desulfobacterales bacterium]|nr:hypothetical protein [Desulfobacterales bacterium]
MKKIKLYIHLILAVVYTTFFMFFTFFFYDRYWKWRHELEEVETSFITPDGSNVTSSGFVWIIPAVVFSILALIRIIRFLKDRHSLNQ